MKIVKKSFITLLFILISMSGYAEDTATNSIAKDLEEYFNQLGPADTTDKTVVPTVEKQQAGNYTWNQLSPLISKERKDNVTSVTLPGSQYTCGNIDVINGGNKILKGDTVTNGLKGILGDTENTVYPFTLTLETVSPMIAKNLLYWKDYADQMNRFAINSCENSLSLGSSVTKMRATQQRNCEEYVMQNKNLTWLEAKQVCSGVPTNSVNYDLFKNEDEYKKLNMEQGNIVWNAIKPEHPSTENYLEFLFMNLSGTIVYKTVDNNTTKRMYPALANQIDIMNAILNGGKIKLYTCKDPAGEDPDCLDPVLNDITISPEDAYKTKIKTLIDDISKKVINDEELTTAQKNFIANTSLPILQIIMVSNANPNTNINYLDLYIDLIATDMMFRYLEDSLIIVQNSLMISPATEEDAKLIRDNIEKNLIQLRDRQSKITKNLEMTLQVINQTQMMERMLMNNLSTDLAKSIAWAKGLK